MKEDVKKYLEEEFKGHEIGEITQVKDWEGFSCFRVILNDNIFYSLYVLVEGREITPIGFDSINDGANDSEFWDIDKANGNYFKSCWEGIDENSDE